MAAEALAPHESVADPAIRVAGEHKNDPMQRALEAARAPRAEVPRISRTRAERLARQLALAHWIERAVEDGRASCYGEVARALGLTESRITQITALLGLPPAVQEGVLLGGGVGIREAIRAAREADWSGKRSRAELLEALYLSKRRAR